MTESKRAASVVAVSQVETLVLNKWDFHRHCDRDVIGALAKHVSGCKTTVRYCPCFFPSLEESRDWFTGLRKGKYNSFQLHNQEFSLLVT